MQYPALFVNHGGGPLPLLGRQPHLSHHMTSVVQQHLPPTPPTSIVVISAHWESDPIRITSHPNPSMLYDYYGFPPETYEYQYPAPGNSALAAKIQTLLHDAELKCELDPKRDFDHGVFVPLMLMYPDANIPVVSVSLHSSLSAGTHIRLGQALAPLRGQGVLLLGSGYTFHNMHHLMNPSDASHRLSTKFNDWLKETLVGGDNITMDDRLATLSKWESVPRARECHPKEEHLMPLLVTAAAGVTETTVIYDVTAGKDGHAVSGYLFN